MNYRLNSHGQDIGEFSLEELARRRKEGTLIGNELIWREGMPEWRTLNSVLGIDSPPALPSAPPHKGMNPWLMVLICFSVILVIGGLVLFAYVGLRAAKTFQYTVASITTNATVALPSVKQPIVTSSTTTTSADFERARRAFVQREYIDAYEKHGRHDQPWDADARQFLKAWLECYYGTNGSYAPVEQLGNKLAGDPTCNDPVVLLLSGFTAVELFEGKNRLERSVKAFEKSEYLAYPQFYAAAILATKYRAKADHSPQLVHLALRELSQSFTGGSLRPDDQRFTADALLDGACNDFFSRNEKAVTSVLRSSGGDFKWLYLVLDGEREKDDAWRARGGGWADTVTAAGWQGFSQHLAAASTDLTTAWNMHPDWPEAAACMVEIAMGQSDTAGMRQWFNRATTAEIDYDRAWRSMRWALRPRWFGSLDQMRQLGESAVDTGRFDTDVPRKFFDSVTDLEAEESMPLGRHIYGRPDIWPYMQKMYEGYINYTAFKGDDKGWRGTYAIVAYLGGKNSITAEQLAKLDWQLSSKKLGGWSMDLGLMPLEVAARVGKNAAEVADAENARNASHYGKALGLYEKIAQEADDDRTRQFAQARLESLAVEQKLQSGEWVDFLPKSTNDPNWTSDNGTWSVLPDGSVEVESGPEGFLLFSHTRVGPDFEARGEFKVVRSSDGQFQAGIVMGLPQRESWDWLGFRVKRNQHEGSVIAYSAGWSLSSATIKPAQLNDTDNTFDFRLNHGVASARVNDSEIFSYVSRPYAIRVPDNQFLVGLGAFNDMNHTTIRYSHIQIRRLPGDSGMLGAR